MKFLTRIFLVFTIVVIFTAQKTKQGRPRSSQGHRPSSRADSVSSSGSSSRPGSRCGSRPSSRLSNSDLLDGNNNDNDQPSSGCFDHFRFVQSWPKIARNNVRNPIKNLPDTWILHGLWPVDAKGSPIVNCKTDFYAINSNSLGNDLISQLRENWPNLCLSGRECGFWIHEFNKHGSCALGLGGISNAKDYFTKTLALKEKYDATNLFNDLGFKPKEEPYPFRILYRNLQRSGKVNNFVRLECDVRDNKYYLVELHICFDKDFNPTHCVGAGNCYGKEIIYSNEII